MSVPWFPNIPGLTFQNGMRTPLWQGSLLQTSASQKEARMQQQSYPRYSWQLNFNYLHAVGYPNSALAGYYEDLLGFLNQQFGTLLSFYYRDQFDNQVTNQPIGTGNGTQTQFQLTRTYGGFTEPIGVVDTRGAIVYGPYTQPAALVPVAKVSGSAVSATFNNPSPGYVTYASAPGSGDALTATFSYGWLVRFSDDSLDFEGLYNQIFKLGKCKIITTNV